LQPPIFGHVTRSALLPAAAIDLDEQSLRLEFSRARVHVCKIPLVPLKRSPAGREKLWKFF
jgi:hypothetical protein